MGDTYIGDMANSGDTKLDALSVVSIDQITVIRVAPHCIYLFTSV